MSLKKFFSWGVALQIGVFAWSLSGFAAPSLVLVNFQTETDSVKTQLVKRVEKLWIQKSFLKNYDHIEQIDGENDFNKISEVLAKRSKKNFVDVVILPELNQVAFSVQRFLRSAQCSTVNPSTRLRMVYVTGELAASHQEDLRKCGFKYVFGNSAQLGGSRLAIADFFAALARGEEIQKAYLNSQQMALEDSLRVQATQNGASQLSTFQQVIVEISAAIFPKMGISPQGVPSYRIWADEAGDVLWKQLFFEFGSNLLGLPEGGLPSFGDDSESIWLEGEALKYLIEPFLAQVVGDQLEKVSLILEKLQGVRVTRVTSGLRIHTYFKDEFDVILKKVEEAKAWQLYKVHFPTAVRFRVSFSDGNVSVEGLDEGTSTLRLFVKSPSVLPDQVWMRAVNLSLETGAFQIEAGVIGNQLRLFARGDLWARKLDEIDFWGALAQGLDLFKLPELYFRK